MASLTQIATALPDVQQGVACAGTALECASFAVRKKAFLFLSAKEVRLKLDTSKDEATKRGLAVGANGWVKLDPGALPPTAVLTRWVAESYELMAGKAVDASRRAPRRRR
jgi:hypothetical protein